MYPLLPQAFYQDWQESDSNVSVVRLVVCLACANNRNHISFYSFFALLSRFSISSVGIMPDTTDPSAKISVGVPVTLFFCPD